MTKELKWKPQGKNEWVAEDGDWGRDAPPRIKRLDATHFAVYRDCRYLGVEGDLETAQARAALNQRSEINREMDWQREHPDEQPLGLRLTQQERAEGWRRDTGIKPDPRLAGGFGRIDKPLPDATLGKRSLPPTHPAVRGADKATREANTALRKTEAKAQTVRKIRAIDGNRDADIAKLLKRGCTSEEVLKVTGWKAISMPAMAKKLGLKLRIDKGRKPFKYYGEEEK